MGTRFFAPQRQKLDKSIARVEFIVEHVDFAAFVREESHRFASIVGHVVAHFSLRIVRSIERLLTRFVRYLRTRHPVDNHPGENTREFVKTLADFKGRLKDAMPDDVRSAHEEQ